MESTLTFISKFTNVAKVHLEESQACIGKEVVDSTAKKTGICIDRIKRSFGASFSLLGHNYSKEETRQIESFNEDVIVCQGSNNTRFFVPVSNLAAIGESVILTKLNLNYPEIRGTGKREEEIYRKYFAIKEAMKEFLPKVEAPKSRKKKKTLITKIFH
jgi:hypothetical protein